MIRIRMSALLVAVCLGIASSGDVFGEESIILIQEVIDPSPEYARSQGGDLTLVLLSSGRVLRVGDPESLKLVQRIREGMRAGRALRIRFEEVNGRDVIHEVTEAPLTREQELLLEQFGEVPTGDRAPRDDEEDPFTDEDPFEGAPEEEVADSLYTTSELYDYMDDMRLRRSAQCFHRAYLWAYDTWNDKGASTRKVFLFFTQKYIREYSYGWWFHVAPYVDTGSGETVLDPTFTSSPLRMRTWTNVFMKDDHYCPTTSKYTGHGNHYRDRYCYLRKTTMYYYHPNRVERADEGGYVITRWDRSGLKNSKVARP